ncbi:MAG: hypothetical protein HKO63_02800 [Acidimicrobiia bacterium]|nr:hypothetical protein [Acidimicrobiia bacterium]NNF87038.1 hypothetical protein [Acidimicrobiia bacterium]NNJ48370.1 hypothetical protein [Acidimicrobiia bacterium]NNL97112.1 hypothetical protein [Acidimicrobiia bacterium]
MMKRLTTVALAALVLAATPGMAIAQDTTTTERQTEDRQVADAERRAEWFATLQQRALEAIEKRLATIDNLETAINDSTTVHDDHASQLLAELRASTAGLETLAGDIRTAEDLATLWELIPDIFEDYRIYAVVAPKVHLVLASDAAGAVAGRLEQATGALGDALDRLEEFGIDVADAEALLVEMKEFVASGASSAASVPGMVLDLTPADYPGSSETLRSAHAVLQSARTDLQAAGDTAHEIVRFIVGALGGHGSG